MTYDKFAGGIFGLLIGDSLGVPYEFRMAKEIPPYEQIEFAPPHGFAPTYPHVAAGTWSDDGAQAMCLLDSITSRGAFFLDDFSDKLSAWYEHGLWAIDGVVFDVGMQTGEALTAYGGGMSPKACGSLRPEGKGNGALMRVLPLALWHHGTDKELVLDAHSQCLITHGHVCNQVCCALYCLAARYLSQGNDAPDAISKGVASLRSIYRDMPEYEHELEWSVRPEDPWEGTGTGYVVDCLRSAFMIISSTASYEEAVKRAVMLGSDTDTTACVTGGLAGTLYGLETIPRRWYDGLKGKEEVDRLLKRVC